MIINKQQAFKLINKQNNSIFNVRFIKKDGTERSMNARLNVKKYLKGGSMTYDPKKNGSIIAFDMNAMGYRTINTHTLTNLNVNGNKYTVRG
jgi:hypothetical protein